MAQPTIDYLLIRKKVLGELTEEEAHQFDKWYRQSAANRKYYHKALEYFSEEETPVNASEGWAHVQQIITRKKLSTPWYRYAGMAAVLALGMLGGYYWWWPSPEAQPGQLHTLTNISPGTSKATLITSSGDEIVLGEKTNQTHIQDQSQSIKVSAEAISYDAGAGENESAYNTLRVPRGGKFSVVLSDGTKVWINSDSELTYPINFGAHRRLVKLKGEAYFEVAHDATRPFTVTTRNQHTNVLGTSFNVTAYANEQQIVTTLVEGKVRVTVDGQPEGLILTPDYQTIYNSSLGSITRHKVDVTRYTGWKDDLFIFDDQPLHEILATLSRWYDVDVFFENDKVAHYHFTGEIERYENIENILKLIELTNAVEFEIKQKTIIVK